MASWVTHTWIADRLLSMGLPLDRRGFTVGSIAPDCNIENADWSAFTPPREVTHFMHTKQKTAADYEAFYAQYLCAGRFLNEEHRAFLWGYYAHLVADVAFRLFAHDETRIAASFARIKRIPTHRDALAGLPETFDTLKAYFGKRALLADIAFYEAQYLQNNPDNSYDCVLRAVTDFPDYLDFLPPGAIPRKIDVMTHPIVEIPETDLLHVTGTEYEAFLSAVCEALYETIRGRI